MQDEKELREQNRHKYSSAEQAKDCDHEMEYSQILGVVGGYCKKCGYRTY